MGDVQAEIELLREENRQLKDILCPPIAFPAAWALSPMQRRALACLLSADEVSRERLGLAVYGWERQDRQIFNVFIFNLRRRLFVAGLSVQTVWGFGYKLRDRAKWRAALKGRTDEQFLEGIS